MFVVFKPKQQTYMGEEIEKNHSTTWGMLSLFVYSMGATKITDSRCYVRFPLVSLSNPNCLKENPRACKNS